VPPFAVVEILVDQTAVTHHNSAVDHRVARPAYRTPDDRLDRIEHRTGG
jgi:hypothetical protein